MPHSIKGCKTMEEFVGMHMNQLTSSGIPEKYWVKLYEKLSNELLDAGQHFLIQKVVLCDEEYEGDEDEIEENDGDTEENDEAEVDNTPEIKPDEVLGFKWKVVVSGEEGISMDDPNHVYLVDHAWTYRVHTARTQLEQIPSLLHRMVDLMDISVDNRDNHQLTEEVLHQMWRYNQTYNIGNAERGSADSEPVWYVMDEFGSRIQHADDPSFRVVPLFYIPSRTMFSVMFPIKNLAEGDEVTRNFIEGGVTDRLTRKLRLLPWLPEDMTHLSFDQQEASQLFFEQFKEHHTLPPSDAQPPVLPKDCNIRVFTDISQVARDLTDPRFELVGEEEGAHIVWTLESFHDFKGFHEKSPECIINQFPCENVLTVKDLLAQVARRSVNNKKLVDYETLETLPKWLPTTFDLKTELSQFVSYFQKRKEKALDNHWICKPWNLARSMDMHITDNLNYILRLPDTGPKVANKYVENPVLYQCEDDGPLKFDLRFLVLLRSVDPLVVYIHKKFLVRLANKAYSLDTLDDFEKHFTAMLYKGLPTKEVICDEFITDFEAQYPDQCWIQVEQLIHSALGEVMKAATDCPPPCGIGASPQSRAMYGADIILKWDQNEKGERTIQPQLLELNFCPDSNRLNHYHSDLTNDCFSALIFDDIEGRDVIQIA